MKIRTLILGLASAAVLLGAAACSTVHDPRSALQGTWTGREIGNAPETPRELVVSGMRIEYRGALSNDWGKGTFTLKQETQPKQILVTLAECGMPQYTGKTCCMIYKLENGTLTAAASEPGVPAPPVSFDAPHARRMIFTKQ